MEYFIPQDSSELLKRKGLKAKDVDNFSLRFNKFTKKYFNEEKRKYEFNLRDVHFSFDKQVDKIEKQQSIIKSLYTEYESLNVENNWRLAIGIGTGSVYETSITLHHIYGIPFIPAQSIKGALRSYIIQKYFYDELFSEEYKDKYSKFEEEILYKRPWFVDIFGSNDKQGKVIFFDAFTKESEIKIDIMNNHYRKYYNGTLAPNDTQNPNPVNFMTLKNAKFEITIATKENIKIKEGLFKDKDILILVKEELSNALEVFGIGAKTAVGYGYFETIKSEEDKSWERVKDTKDIKVIESFIARCPDSKYIDNASTKLEELKIKIENEKREKEQEKFAKINQNVQNAWNAIQKKKVNQKQYKKELEKFIKKWSQKKNNKGSEMALEYVEKAKNELK